MKMMRSGVLVLPLALLICSCKSSPAASGPNAAAAPKNPAFVLWEDVQDMHKRAGLPAKANIVTESYMRHTAVGDVKVVISLLADASRSHLNPAIRVQMISFWFDKDVKLRDGLGAIAELRAVCAGGCKITGRTDGVIHSARATAPPRDEAEKQIVRDLAFVSVSISGEGAERAKSAERASLTIEIEYRDVPQEFNFETTPVSELTLTVSDPVQNEKSDRIVGGKLVTLPVYKPS